jgi:hypothetical protein
MQTLFVALVSVLVAGAGTALAIVARDEAQDRIGRDGRCSSDE